MKKKQPGQPWICLMKSSGMPLQQSISLAGVLCCLGLWTSRDNSHKFESTMQRQLHAWLAIVVGVHGVNRTSHIYSCQRWCGSRDGGCSHWHWHCGQWYPIACSQWGLALEQGRAVWGNNVCSMKHESIDKNQTILTEWTSKIEIYVALYKHAYIYIYILMSWTKHEHYLNNKHGIKLSHVVTKIASSIFKVVPNKTQIWWKPTVQRQLSYFSIELVIYLLCLCYGLCLKMPQDCFKYTLKVPMWSKAAQQMEEPERELNACRFKFDTVY